VVVRDDDAGTAKVDQLGWSDHIALAVVVARVVWQQHAETVANGDARSDQQEGIGEPGVLGVRELVQRLPRDEHGHDDGLAAACGHLERHPEQARVVPGTCITKGVRDPLVAVLASYLGGVDSGLDGFDLAEEQRPLALGVRPVVQEFAGGPRDAHMPAASPLLHPGPNAVDELVLLDAVGRPLRIERGMLTLLLGPRDGNEVLADAALRHDLVGDAVLGEAEVPLGLREWRVDDGVLDDDLTHGVPPERGCARLWRDTLLCGAAGDLPVAPTRGSRDGCPTAGLDGGRGCRPTADHRRRDRGLLGIGAVARRARLRPGLRPCWRRAMEGTRRPAADHRHGGRCHQVKVSRPPRAKILRCAQDDGKGQGQDRARSIAPLQDQAGRGQRRPYGALLTSNSRVWPRAKGQRIRRPSAVQPSNRSRTRAGSGQVSSGVPAAGLVMVTSSREAWTK